MGCELSHGHQNCMPENMSSPSHYRYKHRLRKKKMKFKTMMSSPKKLKPDPYSLHNTRSNSPMDI